MDTLNLRGGKYRPFLLFTPFLIFLATVASFWNIDISIAHKAIYAGITYVLWERCMRYQIFHSGL
ncbi:hypothetical protein OIU92_05155 [Escherichia coli]|nr:hypothetical protein [Escherichia coli]